MNRLLLILTVCVWPQLLLQAQLAGGIHENERQTPYPQEWHTLYVNPAPLLVPASMKESDYLQFNLSRDKDFESPNAILSKPVPWLMFNPHRILESGTAIYVFLYGGCLQYDGQSGGGGGLLQEVYSQFAGDIHIRQGLFRHLLQHVSHATPAF